MAQYLSESLAGFVLFFLAMKDTARIPAPWALVIMRCYPTRPVSIGITGIMTITAAIMVAIGPSAIAHPVPIALVIGFGRFLFVLSQFMRLVALVILVVITIIAALVASVIVRATIVPIMGCNGYPIRCRSISISSLGHGLDGKNQYTCQNGRFDPWIWHLCSPLHLQSGSPYCQTAFEWVLNPPVIVRSS